MTVERLLFERGGVLKAARAAAHLQGWTEAARSLGDFPTTVEVAAYWQKSERQAWRWRSEIRRLLQEEEFEGFVRDALATGEDVLEVEVRPRVAR